MQQRPNTIDSFKRSLVCWGYIYMYIDACLIVTCTVACTQVFQLFVVVNQNTIHRINHLVFQCFPPITPMACRLRLCVQCTYTISLPLWGFMFYVCLYLIFLKYSIQYIIYQHMQLMISYFLLNPDSWGNAIYFKNLKCTFSNIHTQEK